MADLFAHMPAHLTAPLEHAAAVTPADGSDLANFTRSIFIGTGGDLKVDMVGGETVTFSGMSAGLFPLRVARVYSTGTTASDIVALW